MQPSDTEHEQATKTLNGAAKKVDKAADRMWSGLRLLLVMAAVIIVFQFALQWQIIHLGNKVDTSSHNTAQVKVSVKELTDFANDLQTQTPAEQANSAAVQRAVSLVPLIVTILCDQFPDSEGCP